jgi:hypothetical protein
VNPPGVTTWRLDGETRHDRLPLRVRRLATGAHQIEIDGPPGFMSQSQAVTVEKGKAPKVEITLEALKITGVFNSTPSGSSVSLIVDGKREPLGTTPAKAPLDPRHSYQVLFEKPGYVSVNRPVVFTGVADEQISVMLDKVAPGTGPGPGGVAIVPPHAGVGPIVHPEHDPRVQPPKDQPPKDQPPKDQPPKDQPPKDQPPKDQPPVVAKGNGSLMLGSKPPCDIFIDGADSGTHTPQRDLKLSAGKHKITLVNNEFGIKETFYVDIKPDAPNKEFKDYSDRLPQSP